MRLALAVHMHPGIPGVNSFMNSHEQKIHRIFLSEFQRKQCLPFPQSVIPQGIIPVFVSQGMHKNKVMTVKKPGSDARSRDAVVEEAHVLTSLQHDHVVRILGVVMRPQQHSLVLECLHDGDLRW